MSTGFLTKDEERALIAQAQNGDVAARNTLIERNLGLIYQWAKHCAERYRLHGCELFGEAVLTYMKCIENFNPSYGLRLSTIAVLSIQRRLWKESFELRGPILVPYISRKGAKTLTEETQECRRSARRAQSLHYEQDADGTTLSTTLAFREEEKKSEEIKYPHWQVVAAAVAKLPERQRKIIELRLQGGTLEDVGQVEGVSRERIRQIEAKAVQRLRDYLGVKIELGV